MLFISPHTANSLAQHVDAQSWVMFVQASSPASGMGPIKIEGVRGAQIATRLRQIAAENAYETFIVGLIATDAPGETESALHDQFASAHLHDDWFSATDELLALIQQGGQQALQELLAAARGVDIPDGAVDIEAIASFLNVSTKTIRRLVKAGSIPALRMGKALRFVVADVLASLERRER